MILSYKQEYLQHNSDAKAVENSQQNPEKKPCYSSISSNRGIHSWKEGESL